MSALEQSFTDLIAGHSLTGLSIAAAKHADGTTKYLATAHWDGFSRTGIACEIGHGDTIAEALANLFKSVTLLRTPKGATLADEPLPAEG